MGSTIYFFISYEREDKEETDDMNFIIPENKDDKPKCIYCIRTCQNNKYFYKKIFKSKKFLKNVNKENEYYFEFLISDDNYVISFDSKGSTFIYDSNLEIVKKELDIRRKVDQYKESILY